MSPEEVLARHTESLIYREVCTCHDNWPCDAVLMAREALAQKERADAQLREALELVDAMSAFAKGARYKRLRAALTPAAPTLEGEKL